MRFLATLLLITVASTGLLQAWFLGSTDHVGFALLSVAIPVELAADETYSIRGGVRLPRGRFEKRFHICGDTGCATKGWGAVEGPADWWGYIGELDLDPGEYTVDLTFYRADGQPDVPPIARYAWQVTAH